MASYKAIAAIGQVVVKFLENSSRNEFPNAEFKLLKVSDFSSAKGQPKIGASVCLYHVEQNPALRNLPSQEPNPMFVPLTTPLKLSFLITPWAEDLEMQSGLLGWIISALDNHPVFPAASLNEVIPNEAVFSDSETVRLAFEPISLPDLKRLARILKHPNVLFSIAYSVSLAIDPLAFNE
jgi:hypothetical protein